MIECGHRGLRVVSFNGGGSAAVMAPGLVNEMPGVCLTIGVPTADSGGSTRRFRELAGGPAAGDARRALSSISANGAGSLFEKRFDPEDTIDTLVAANETFSDILRSRKLGGGVLLKETIGLATDIGAEICRLEGKETLHGHPYGNFILEALRRQHNGDLMPAVQQAGAWLEATAHIVPVTKQPHTLSLFDAKKHIVVRGEGKIDEYELDDSSGAEAWLECGGPVENHTITNPQEVAQILEARAGRQPPQASREIIAALDQSDIITIGPGSFVTSVLAAVLPAGVVAACRRQKERGGLRVLIENNGGEKRMPDLHLSRSLEWLGQYGIPVSHALHDNDSPGLLAEWITVDHDGTPRIGTAQAIGASLLSAKAVPDHGRNDSIAHLRSTKPPTNVGAVAAVLQELSGARVPVAV